MTDDSFRMIYGRFDDPSPRIELALEHIIVLLSDIQLELRRMRLDYQAVHELEDDDREAISQILGGDRQ